MKQYLLFVFDHYYPNGGLLDLKGEYDSLEVALEASVPIINEADGNDGFSTMILDSKTRTVIEYTKTGWATDRISLDNYQNKNKYDTK